MDNQDINQNTDKHNEQVNEYLIPARKKLYRSPNNSFLFGIAGGISEYLNVSPVFIRVLFIFSALLGGWGIIAYVICLFLIPEHPSVKAKGRFNRINSPKFLGFILVVIGTYNWIPPFGVFKYIDVFNYADSLLFAVLILSLGIFVLLKGKEGNSDSIAEKQNKLYRSVKRRRVLGVCEGLSIYLGTDVNVIRMLWILLSFITIGIAALSYFIVGYFIPREESEVVAND